MDRKLPIIVVEGRDDTRRLKEIDPRIETIETNGSAINQETLSLIQKAHNLRGVIVFTDPDYPGQRIRSIIQEAIPTVQHAFLTRKEAISKKNRKSLGIEHASTESIQKALKNVYTVSSLGTDSMEEEITNECLLYYHLIGHDNSSILRNQLTEELNIGHVNGKQLLKRLNMFHIKRSDIEQIMLRIENH